ncbi:Plasmodium exported protein (PHIST), unknown function [Plasmodium vivax]|nr:Plasmodium exported protein (PHIST), unknown function [Plasmodium vivax]
MNIKGGRPFAPSRYITVVIPALLCLFLQNNYAYYGDTTSESQYGSKGCSRMLSETNFRKSKKGNGPHKIANHNRRNDFANTSKNNHGEFNARELIDFLEDSRSSKGDMVKHHKKNKRTSAEMNGKRKKKREQYFEEQEVYDEYNGQNGQYNEESYDNGYRNGSYYGEAYAGNNGNGQTYADERQNNHNYTNEEYYNGEPDMYNGNEEENIPDNDHGNLNSFDNVRRGHSKDGRSPKRDNTNNVISRVNGMGNTQTSEMVNSYETYKNNNKSSQNSDCGILQEDVDAILNNLNDLVHDTDMLNIFVLVNVIERNKFFESLQSLMLYWNDYANASKIPDEYKTKQWLKVYSDMTDELMQRERKFYNKLHHILVNTYGPKKTYVIFIKDVRCTWIKMRQEIERYWKDYLENKARRYVKKNLNRE